MIDREVVLSWGKRNAPELVSNFDGLVKLYKKKVLKENVIAVTDFKAPFSTITDAIEGVPVSLIVRKLQLIQDKAFVVCKICGKKNCEHNAEKVERRVATIQVVDSTGEIKVIYFYDGNPEIIRKMESDDDDYLFISGMKKKTKDGNAFEFQAKKFEFITREFYTFTNDALQFFSVKCDSNKELKAEQWEEFLKNNPYNSVYKDKESYFVVRKDDSVYVANVATL